MKELSIFKCGIILITIFIISCASTSEIKNEDHRPISMPNSLLLVPGQIPLPKSIKGVQFFRENYQESPPILRLHSEDKLILRFDELTSLSGQFTISFTHCNKDWQPSGLMDSWVYNGFSEFSLLGGILNEQTRPSYFTYSMELSNSMFLISGNFLLHVHDYESGKKIFNLPFFVTEDIGTFKPDTKVFYNKGSNGTAKHQLSGVYVYPDFLEFPEFNLFYLFAQNRFWKKTVSPNQKNYVESERSSFRLTEEQYFEAYVGFNNLDLREVNLQNAQIFGYYPTSIPEKIVLREDYFNFERDSRTFMVTGFGIPVFDKQGKYLNVKFRYQTQGIFPKDSEIYLVGDFNQWTISKNYKLLYDNELHFFYVDALIKQGVYKYNYVIIKNDVPIDVYNSENLNSPLQEYSGFIYYQDSELHYDRLLNTKIFYSN